MEDKFDRNIFTQTLAKIKAIGIANRFLALASLIRQHIAMYEETKDTDKLRK